MINESGVHPSGYRVLVLPDEVEEVTPSGIVISKQTTEKEQMAQIVATVVEIGHDAYADTTKDYAEVGQKVLIAKLAGFVWKGKDGKNYRLINDRDVIAWLEE